MLEVAPTDQASDTRRRILDAAEQIFADFGYAASGMKMIAAEAGVAQASLHYHFESKEGLYEKVVERRTAAINSARRSALEGLVAQDRSNDLEAILDALFRPALSPEAGGVNYARILAAMSSASKGRDVELVRRYYDDIAHHFIEVMARAVPPHDRRAAAWAYSYSIGALVSQMAHTGRSERLANEAPEQSDFEKRLRRLVRFCAAGIREVMVEEAESGAAN
ncbi:MAG: TetR family transcriptional regulator [Nitratireductor sp.]|nr:TetR family transcriptional regulator [Nitratireductor sp.]